METGPAAQEAAPCCHDKLLVKQIKLTWVPTFRVGGGAIAGSQSVCGWTPLVWDDDHLGYQEHSRGVGTELASLETFSSLLFQPF